MLKDDPGFADYLQPTRENVVSIFSLSHPLMDAPVSPDPIWMGLTSDFGRALDARIEEPCCERGRWGLLYVSL